MAGLDVLDVLAQLVNKSLVTVDEQMAQRAIACWKRSANTPAKGCSNPAKQRSARNRHLKFYVQLTEAAEPKLIGRDMIAALDQLEAEQDNLRAALEWALDNDPVAALRMVGSALSIGHDAHP